MLSEIERTHAGDVQTLLQMSGASAPSLEARRAALLVIDAQQEYATGALPLDGLEGALTEIERLGRWARASDVPVVNIRHEGTAGAKVFASDTPFVDFLPRAAPVAGDKIVTKTLPNAFAKTRLQEVLNSLDRDQLVLVGFMAHMCVDATARAALDLGYQAFIVATATADHALPSFDGSVVPSEVVLRSTLAALGDRFATIFRHSDALLASASRSPTAMAGHRA